MVELYFKILKNLNGTYQVSVNLDSTESINATSGSINLLNGFKINDIKINNSIINFWIEEPKILDNKITFSGIRPGGFVGKDGEIFSLTIPSEPKLNSLSWDKTKTEVLLNDGEGAKASATFKNLEVKSMANLEVNNDQETVDLIPPESFTPLISKSDDLFEGKNFIVFSTVDKQSSVDHYEVAERQSWFPVRESRLDWQKVSSPAQLKDQNLSSFVYIKAVDQFGNSRIEVIHPIASTFPFHPYFFWSIIIIMAVGLGFSMLKIFLIRR